MTRRPTWSRTKVLALATMALCGFIFVVGSQAVYSEVSPSIWSKTYDAVGAEILFSATQTSDGGYALVGSHGAFTWVVKTDSSGRMQWNQSYDDEISGMPECIVQSTDGGFAISGLSGSQGFDQFWVLKMDSQGKGVWSKSYGNGYSMGARSLVQMDDGGYVVVGDVSSNNTHGWDTLVVRVDSLGNSIWSKTYGGINDDRAMQVIKSKDNYLVLAGFTNSNGSEPSGPLDYWLAKLDFEGNMIWTRSFGGNQEDYGTCLAETADGGFVMAGQTRYGAYPAPQDFWLVKTDASGNMQWNKTYGGSDAEEAMSVIQTKDGGYAIVGITRSIGAGSTDFWLVKTDSSGNKQWSRTYGGRGHDLATNVFQTEDGGYVLAGSTDSYGSGDYDFWLIKTDAQGLTVNEPATDGSYPTPNPSESPTPNPSSIVQLDVWCKSSTSYSNFQVDITGKLSANETAIPNSGIRLSYSVTGGESWNDLTLVNTDENGNFAALWTPLVSGNYFVKALWKGNSTYPEIYKIVSFAITPYERQSIFSVSSNSTISGLAFDSVNRQLNFTVAGDSGTTGYVDVYISKSLVSNPGNLIVYLDAASIDHAIKSQDDSWLVSFNYHHSTHSVSVNLGSKSTTPNGSEVTLIFIGILITLSVISLAILAVKRTRNKKICIDAEFQN
jgi:hypothetical protein